MSEEEKQILPGMPNEKRHQNNKGKKYKSKLGSKKKTITPELRSQIPILYFVNGWSSDKIHTYLNSEKKITISSSAVRSVISEEMKLRQEVSREILKEEYSEIYRAEKEKVFQEIDYFGEVAREIFDEMPDDEKYTCKAWIKANEFRFKARDQLMAFILANKDNVKKEDFESTIKALEDKLKLNE
jgi:hypothetical protein